MSAKMIFKDPKFSPLFWTQFFGALNDNLLKNALVMLITFQSVSLWGLSTGALIPLCHGIFILPFFLFSPLAGQIADKLQKANIARWVKFIELGIMVIAGIGFYFHWYGFLIFCLFMMGLHSTVFGPIKYSIIPELVSEKNLVSGNAYVEVGTFLAILIGTIAGGLLSTPPDRLSYLTGVLIVIAAIGIMASLKIPNVRISDPSLKISYNPFPEIWKNISEIYPQKAVFNSLLGISWFWFFGASLLTLLPLFTRDILKGDEHVVTLFLALFTIGIAVGSVICEKLSFDRVEIGLVPPGSLGMSLFIADLAWAAGSWNYPGTDLLGLSNFISQPHALRICLDLFAISVFGGIFTVPLYTLLQSRSQASHRSRVIAANNIMNSLFMVVASVMLMILQGQGVSIIKIFALVSVLNLLVSIYIYSLVPEFTLRFISWILTHFMYRVRVHGDHHIPKEGPAVLVCNHVTFIDWLILMGWIKRPVRFVMYYKYFEMPMVKYLVTQAKVIPIAGQKENPEIFKNAFDIVSKELKEGELVCIFPEGSLTMNGEVQEFKSGIEHILKRDPVPVIPMALKGLWGSFFSHKDGKAMNKVPRRILFPVHLTIGKAEAPESVTAKSLESEVKKLLDL